MPFPFRTPASSEDTWEPPDYAVPVKASSEGEWSPPSYATPVKKEEEKKPSAFSRAIEALKPAKTIKPTGSLLPSFLKPSTEPIPYESDEEKSAKKAAKPEEKGLFSRAVESASKFLGEHPRIREAGQRFLTGTSPEFEEEMKKRGVSEIQGPGIMSIPGVKKATDYLSQKVAGSEGNTRLAAGAVIQALGGILEGGFDPRTAGIKASGAAGELPIRQSREIPYRMEESVKVKPPEISTVAPTQTPEELKPKAEIPAAAAAVEEKKPFVSPFEKKAEKPLEQTFGELGGVGHPDEPEYANKVLARAGKGEPGLAVEPIEGLDNVNHVVYRNKDGEPIAAAMVVRDQSGKTLVQDLAADKSRGLLTGRAMKALGGKLEELGATESSGTMSADAENFLAKMKERAKTSESEWKPPEYAKPVEINASGESAASQEAINRQTSMKAKGEQYVVYDRAGNARPLIGPEAVDYQPRPGETFGIITQKRGFRVLESRGGKIPSMFTKLSSERGSMTIGEGMPAFSEGPRGETGRTLIRNTQSEVRSLLRATLPEDLEKFNSYVAEGSANADYAKAVVPMKIKDLADTLREKAEWGLKNFTHDNVPGQRSELEQTSRYLHKLADRLEKRGDAETLYKVKNELLQDVDKPSMFRRLSSETGSMNISGGTPGGGEPFEGPQGRVLNKLFNALEDAKGRVSEQADINRVTRARRFAAFGKVEEEGALGAAKSLRKLKGEYEKVEPGGMLASQLKEPEIDSLFTAVKQANITAGEKARGYTALFKLMNGEGTPVRSELKILDDVFGNGFADKVTELHGGLGLVGLKVSKLASTMKSMQNALSLAAPLRHGIGLVYKSEFYPAFKDMFKFFANKEFYNTSMKALEERPNYLLGRDSGLFLAKPGSLQGAEEEFLNSYVGALPGIRNVVGASQRAYTGFLNKLRADVFDSMTKQAEGLGAKMSVGAGDSIEATREARAIAKFINNATGRGDLGSLNKITNELNVMFWSPRMISSRVNMLANPKIYMDLPKGMRLEGLKSLLGIAALGTTIDTLAAYGGAKISSNILSTDFGKSRFGTKLIDPWGGFQQYVVFAARFLAGKTDSQHPQTRLDIGERFIANKLSPVASLARNILTAKPGSQGKEGPGTFTTQYGQPTSVQREVAKTFTPIFIQDLQTLAQSEPDWSENIGLTAAMAGASLTGMAQEYPQKQTGKLGFRKMKLKP